MHFDLRHRTQSQDPVFLALSIVKIVLWSSGKEFLEHNKSLERGGNDFLESLENIFPLDQRTIFTIDKARKTVSWLFVKCHKSNRSQSCAKPNRPSNQQSLCHGGNYQLIHPGPPLQQSRAPTRAPPCMRETPYSGIYRYSDVLLVIWKEENAHF